MVLTIKRRFAYYRRFEKDIWGLSFCNFNLKAKITKFFYKLHLEKEEYKQRLVRRYIYRIDIVKPIKKKKYMKWQFVSLRLVKLFFLTLKYKQFRMIAIKAARKDGLFQNHFCSLLEGRLVSFVYRTNFLYSMFEIINFVRNGNVFIDGVLVNYVNYVVGIGKFVTFNPFYYSKFRMNMIRRFRTRGFIFNTPRYLYISFKLFFVFMERYPYNKDLAYPIPLDIYRAVHYF